MKRLSLLLILLLGLLASLLVASCTTSEDPLGLGNGSGNNSGNNSGNVSPDKRGVQIFNPPSPEEMYLLDVKASFSQVEWNPITITLDRRGDSFSFVPEGYDPDRPVIVKIDPNAEADRDGMPLLLDVQIQLPLPPEPGTYLDVFGDNIIFRTKGFENLGSSTAKIFIPIMEWNNPAGLNKTMCSYNVKYSESDGLVDALNIHVYNFDETPSPGGKAQYIVIDDVIGIGEPDIFTDTVLDDIILD